MILAAVPHGARRSLDVGCGEGMLARDLRRDFMTHPFESGSFDHIASVAALHHMDASAALQRMRELLAPGGMLAIVRYRRRLLWRYSLVWTKPA